MNNWQPTDAELYAAFVSPRRSKAEIAALSLEEVTHMVGYRRQRKVSPKARDLPLSDEMIAEAIVRYGKGLPPRQDTVGLQNGHTEGKYHVTTEITKRKKTQQEVRAMTSKVLKVLAKAVGAAALAYLVVYLLGSAEIIFERPDAAPYVACFVFIALIAEALFPKLFSSPESTITSKSCENCGKGVPSGAHPGQRCPHCGVLWTAEKIRRT